MAVDIHLLEPLGRRGLVGRREAGTHLDAGRPPVEHILDVRPSDDASGRDDRDVDRVEDLGQKVEHVAISAQVSAGFVAFNDHGGRTELLAERRHSPRTDDRDHRGGRLTAPPEDVAREASARDDEIDALLESSLNELLEVRDGDHDVDADDAVGLGAGRADLLGKLLRLHAGASDEADAAAFGDCCGERPTGDLHRHATLDDRKTRCDGSDCERWHGHREFILQSAAETAPDSLIGRPAPETGWIRCWQ